MRPILYNTAGVDPHVMPNIVIPLDGGGEATLYSGWMTGLVSYIKKLQLRRKNCSFPFISLVSIAVLTQLLNTGCVTLRLTEVLAGVTCRFTHYISIM